MDQLIYDLKTLWALPGVHAAINAVVILVVGWGILLAARLMVRRVGKHAGFNLKSLRPLERILQWFVLGIAFFVALASLGWSLEGLWTFLSTMFALIAVGFIAVWSVLSNFICALLIRIQRPFFLGDWVGFPGEPVGGVVTDLALTFTTLKSDDGTLFRVPNNLFFQKTIACRPSG